MILQFGEKPIPNLVIILTDTGECYQIMEKNDILYMTDFITKNI
jgi:hypothetical protein